MADLFPMIEGDELAAFIADIKVNKLQRPILLARVGRELLVVDGRTRQLACFETGVKPRYEEWDGKGDLLSVICSLNLKHRSMSKTDLAVAAESAAKGMGDVPVIDGGEPTITEEAAAKLQKALGDERLDVIRKVEHAARVFGVSARYVYEVRRIRRDDIKVYNLMRKREINLSQATNRLERSRREAEVAQKAAQAKIVKGALRIIRGDCIEEMNRLTPGIATVIFADPPYNIGWKYDGDVTGDDLPIGEYLDWTQQWVNAAVKLLANNGSMFVLIDDNYSDHLGIILRRSGLHRRNTIIWWETFGVHQTGNFSRCARYLHYYTKSPKGFIFHPEPVESERQRLNDPRANQDGKIPDNVWSIPRVVGNDASRVPFEDAPPQVPIELPMRAIVAASEPGDLVVDPFNGNGTTAIAALLAGRKFIGVERSAKYAAQAEKWIRAQVAARAGQKVDAK